MIINVTVGLSWRGTETTDFVEGEERRIRGMQAKPNFLLSTARKSLAQ